MRRLFCVRRRRPRRPRRPLISGSMATTMHPPPLLLPTRNSATHRITDLLWQLVHNGVCFRARRARVPGRRGGHAARRELLGEGHCIRWWVFCANLTSSSSHKHEARSAMRRAAAVVFHILLLLCATSGLIGAFLVVVALQCVCTTARVLNMLCVERVINYAGPTRTVAAVDRRHVLRHSARVRAHRVSDGWPNGKSNSFLLQYLQLLSILFSILFCIL